ncbi:unnamed protein product [Musa acuminata var. zebrina]
MLQFAPSDPKQREARTAPSQQLLSREGHYWTWEKGGLENGIGIKSGEKCASQDGGYGITSLLFPFLFSLPFPPTPTVVALPFPQRLLQIPFLSLSLASFAFSVFDQSNPCSFPCYSFLYW